MPKPRTNDDLVQRHKQLRETLIAACSKSAAAKIIALEKPTANEIAESSRTSSRTLRSEDTRTY